MNKTVKIIELTFTGKIGSEELDDKSISLEKLSLILENAKDFIYGKDDVSVDFRDALKPLISHGSLKLSVFAPEAIAAAFLSTSAFTADMDAVRHNRLPKDNVRARAFSKMKSAMIHDKDSQIEVSYVSNGITEKFVMDSATTLRSPDADVYIDSEFYTTAEPVYVGGASKANIHLKLASGDTITASSTKQYLRDNLFLYEPIRVRVAFKQNIETRERKDYVLKEILGRKVPFDRQKFADEVVKSTVAWSDVPDSVAWVRDLRGGSADE